MSDKEETVKVEEEGVKEMRTEMSRFYKRYNAIGKQLDAFMVEFKRYLFEFGQVENALVAKRGLIRESEIRLEQVEREAQTRLESVEMGHRALVEKLSNERQEIQKERAELKKAKAEVDRLKGDYAALAAQAGRKVKSLSEIKEKVQA